MSIDDAVSRLGAALAIGVMVGVERHWRERDGPAGQRAAGVRTFGISGLVGGIAAMLGAGPGAFPITGALLLGMCFLGHSVAIVLFTLREVGQERGFSVTTVAASQATFLLGAAAAVGDPRLAAAAAIALVAVLASPDVLRHFIGRLSWSELRAPILLLAMTLLVLPLAPDRPFERLAGINPARTWMLAILLAGVSFAGYAALRLLALGRGVLPAGAAGGLFSATGVVLTNARTATELTASPFAAGAMVAGCVGYLRTLALARVASADLAGHLVLPLLAGAAVQGAAAVALAWRPSEPRVPNDPPGNPFGLGGVLTTALLIAGVGLAARLAAQRYGGGAVLAVAGFSGLADADAVTLSIGGLVPEAISAQAGAYAVAGAVLVSTAARAVYALMLGPGRFGLLFGAGSAAAVMATAVLAFRAKLGL